MKRQELRDILRIFGFVGQFDFLEKFSIGPLLESLSHDDTI